MQIIKEDVVKFKYAFDFDSVFEVILFCKTLKSSLGASKISFYKGKWRFSDLSIMYKILDEYPETAVRASMQEDLELYEIDQKKESIRLKKTHYLKKAKETDFVVNGIKGELYPYQKIGVEFFINNNGKAILADTMGLGKTLQSIAFITHTKKDKVLVICPSVVKYSWESEVEKWSDLKPFVITSKTKLSELSGENFDNHNVYIVNYDIIKKFAKHFNALRWDCIICDEFHYIKNRKAQRTKAVKKIASNIPSILLLSGTPMLNRPVELFNGLQLMDPEKWNDWYEYTKKYCGGHQGPFGWDAKGSSNIDELQLEISNYFLRRNKDEVLLELPPKNFIDIPVVLDPDTQKKYTLAEENFIDYLKNIKKKTDIEARRSMQAETLVKLNELRKLTSEGKIQSAIDTITDIVNSGEKVVVFSVYNSPLDELAEHFGNSCVTITGKTPDEERGNIVKSFQNDSEKVIFLGGMKAAGAGITLTAASNVLFLDFSWVPADHWQASDRIHRIGQEANSVSIYQLYARGTIDVQMKAILAKKGEIFKRLIDGEKGVKGGQTVVKEVINSFTS